MGYLKYTLIYNILKKNKEIDYKINLLVKKEKGKVKILKINNKETSLVLSEKIFNKIVKDADSVEIKQTKTKDEDILIKGDKKDKNTDGNKKINILEKEIEQFFIPCKRRKKGDFVRLINKYGNYVTPYGAD